VNEAYGQTAFKERTMSRISVPLLLAEKLALIDLAQRERRDPRDQAALFIRDELERRGLLPAEAEKGADERA
jgi:hypothetical protein